MTTHALIGYICDGPKVRYSYIHFDGDPQYMSRNLPNKDSEVKKFINESFSYDAVNVGRPPDKLDFNLNNENGVCDYKDFTKHQGISYFYLWIGGNWQYCDCISPGEWHLL